MTSVKPKPLILLAEDDLTLLEMFYTYLTEEGFKVEKAVDGEETLAKIKKLKPAVVLLDLMMPRMSGFEVLEEMKKDAALSKIPVLVFSNLGQLADIQKAKDLGASDYLVKANLTPDDVARKIKEVLE